MPAHEESIAAEPTRARLAMPTWMPTSLPTLVACAVACMALVLVVGLQAPAVSTGLRWTPGPRSTWSLPQFELDGGFELVWGQTDDSWPTWMVLALAVLAIAAILFALARLIRRLARRTPTMHVARTGADTGLPSEADARILQSGLVAAIDVLTAEGERDPGNAVVRAWQGLQDAAATAGLTRRPAETASEFTARILYRSHRSAAPIAVMLALYHRVRFGEHTPTADDIAAAQKSLGVLAELWRADFPERRPPKVARR